MTTHRFIDQPFDMHGVAVLCSGTFHPGDPGRYSGPPEKCYPAEPDELEFESITVGGVNVVSVLSEEFLDRCTDELLRRIPEQVRDEAEALYEQRMDEAFENRFDAYVEQLR